jgi:hypothetical protein
MRWLLRRVERVCGGREVTGRGSGNEGESGEVGGMEDGIEGDGLWVGMRGR